MTASRGGIPRPSSGGVAPALVLEPGPDRDARGAVAGPVELTGVWVERRPRPLDAAAAALRTALAAWRRHPVAAALVLALVVRLLLLGAAEVGIAEQWSSSTQFLGRDAAGRGYTHTPVQIVDVWTRWDGDHYLRLVRQGYDQPPKYLSAAFFPLYPLAIRALSRVTGMSDVAAGLLIANACSIGAWALLALLASRRLGRERAAMAVLLFAVFPTRNFELSLYTEGLFLLLSVGAFLAYEHRRWALAAAAAALVTAVRPQGMLVGGALVADALVRRLWRRDGEAPGWGAIGALSLFPAGLVAYVSFLAATFGRPLLFMDVQKVWGRTLSSPLETVLSPVRGGADQYAALAVALVALVWMVRRRAPVRDLVYAGAALALPLSSGSLQSMARFVGVVFPLFFAAALALEGRRRTVSVYAAVSVAMALHYAFDLARGGAVC